MQIAALYTVFVPRYFRGDLGSMVFRNVPNHCIPTDSCDFTWDDGSSCGFENAYLWLMEFFRAARCYSKAVCNPVSRT